MSFILFLAIFFILPRCALASDDSHTLDFARVLSEAVSIFKDAIAIINKALHYKIVALENQSITIENLFVGLVCLIIGLKASKYISASLKRRLFAIVSLDYSSRNLFGRVIDYFIMAIIVLIVLDIANVPITIFTFIGGALVVSIGLSSQHLINNFISGVVLIVEGNIKVGDLIEYENMIGKVEAIDARSIKIKTQNNIEHIVPHSKLMQEKYSHWTSNGGRIRISTEISIEEKDVVKNDLEKIILAAVAQNREILTTPKPQMLLVKFNNNILHYEVNFWVNLNSSDRRLVLSNVNNRILNTLKSHHIPLAIPTVRHIK